MLKLKRISKDSSKHSSKSVFDSLSFSEHEGRPKVKTWEDIAKLHPYHFAVFESIKDNMLFQTIYVLTQQQNQDLDQWLYQHNGLRNVPHYSSTFPTPVTPLDFINLVRVRDPRYYNSIIQYKSPNFLLFNN